ncbi:MAG: tetratricopeptide repeat protein [Candidatus Tectomicrobia bacterium]|nr:tetratricopeptide repeat protein [Candidatus Tectomicrobia bacterium]
MRAALVLFVLSLSLAGTPSILPAADEPLECGPPSKWEDLPRRIRSPQKLISSLQQAAAGCPGHLAIVDVLGRVLLEHNRPEAAAHALQSGLARTPGLTEALLSAAEAEAAVKNYGRAFRFYGVARAIDPAHSRVRALFRDLEDFLPLSRLKDGMEESMLKVFFEGRRARERLRRNPQDKMAKRAYATFLLTQARALAEAGQSEEGLRFIRRAIQQDPDNQEAREVMVDRILEGGDYHFRGEDYPEALKRYRQTLQWIPNSIEAHIRIAGALQRMPGRREESLATYKRVRELLKSDPEQGSQEKRAGWSRDIQEGLTRVDPQNAVYRRRAARQELNQAERATKQGRLREAIEAHRRALEWTPDDGEIHYSLADTLRYVEDGWRSAIAHYSLAIRHLQENPPAGVAPAEVKTLIRRAERERARLEKSYTGTLAYIRAKFYAAVQERRLEALLFLVVFGSVLVFLWRSKTSDADEGSG